MNDLISKILLGVLAVSLATLFVVPSLGQPAPPDHIRKPDKAPKPEKQKETDWAYAEAPPAFPFGFGGDTAEKSISVDPGVKISLCMTQGTLKINAWNRNEVRVFIKDGSGFGIKVQQKNPRTMGPNWINIYRFDKIKPTEPGANECIWGNEIEIDAPVGSSVDVKGQETETSVDGIKRVTVTNVGGDISLQNIAAGISATTYRGDVTVQNSGGTMLLQTNTGNILVFGAAPSDVGDTVRARTNSGAISLQKLEHRQVDANSISGSVGFTGALLSGGNYNFGTSNGSIKLTLPVTTSCRVFSLTGFGSFNSELPMKIENEDLIGPGPGKKVSGLIGSGDATLRLTTNSGNISIKKQ